MKLAQLIVLSALVVVPLAAASARDTIPDGTYVLVDGPKAGAQVNVSGGHAVGAYQIGGTGTVVGPDADCDQPHYHGSLAGAEETLGAPCGMGRVISRGKTTTFVKDLAYDIDAEERMLAEFREHQSKAPHWSLALYGSLYAERAKEALAEAEKARRISEAAAESIRRRLDAVIRSNEKLKKKLQENPAPSEFPAIIRDIRNALSLKREALAIDERAGSKASTGDAPTPCAGQLQACTVTAFWDVNVPAATKTALCVATNARTGQRVDAKHPVFDGIEQTARCAVTNQFRTVGGERKRVVHYELTLTGTLAGQAAPVRVVVYWPA